MQSVQPRGPYVLGGYCFGGVVALEMARQLRKRGEHVAHLVMIEGQDVRPRFAYLEDVAAAIACRAGIRDETGRRWLAARREDIRRALERIFGRTRFHSSPAAIEKRLRPAQFDPATAHVQHARNRALRAYVWRRVPVRATMLCAREQPDAIPGTVRRDWVSLFEHLDVRLIPGDHITSLTRNLPRLTAELSDILRCNAVAG
jgi:thioesterase domain-containing protein